MYIFPEMLQMTKVVWKSKIHKTMAENLLLCNPAIFELDRLTKHANDINNLSVKEIKKLTIEGAVRMGIPFNA